MNKTKSGLTILQTNPDNAVDLNGGETHGWLYFKHPDGQWVTQRKLSGWELDQAQDQADDGFVIHSPGVRCG